jgi:hypothetical protein
MKNNVPHTPQKSYSEAEVQNMIRILRGTEKAVSGTPSTYFVHGPTGIYAQPGQRAEVMNAMILPVGLQGQLPVRVSRMANEIYPIQTGQTASSGSEPTNACDDAPQPGNLKVVNVTFPFGRLVRDSQVLQADRPGLIVNRSEFLDQQLIGNPFTNLDKPVEIDPQEALRTEVGKKLVELYNSWLLDFAHLTYDGNPSNTSSNTGYIEYNGLDKLINTGYQDAYTAQASAAADSVIVNFGSSPVTGNENQIVKDIVETYAYLEYLSGRVGLNPVRWVIAMRQSLYRKLSEIWPCVYYTYRCVISTSNNTGYVDAAMQVKMRDDMRNGMYDGNPMANPYLLIDGKAVPVIIDDAINESVPAANTFQSDIYFVPVTVRGNVPATFMEYFDLNAPGGMGDVTQTFAPNQFEILGNGRFWLHRKPPTNECVQIRLGAKPRLILTTPFLAARITNVQYSPVLLHERSPFPNSNYYYVDGGSTNFGSPFFYSPTA